MKDDLKNRMKDRNRYVLTGLYVDIKDIGKAAKHLQTLIKRNHDNPTYKNDLGFIWADHDQKLDEAEKLIREALDLDKKRQAMAVHASQIPETSFFLSLPAEAFAAAFGQEWFILRGSRPDGVVERDLFDGLTG